MPPGSEAHGVVPDSRLDHTLPSNVPGALTDDQFATLLIGTSWGALVRSVSRGMVHELRNPLQAISLSAQTIPSAPSPDDIQFLTGAVERSSAQLARTIALVSQLHRVPDQEPAPVLLPDVIAFVNELQRFQRSLPLVPIELVIPPGLPAVVGVDARLSHAVMNLVTNAKEAVGEDQGLVTIRIETEGNEVLVIIEDSGPGVPDEMAARMFEPFTTSKPGRPGVGLPAAQALVSPFDGSIEPGIADGGGARFTIRTRAWLGA